ncbi:MAG: hypothetical protein VKN33_00235 [Candidatus Sericytochromatia bacterium]|nr:hypothetical protein [Candidatus Sericytochromatia bacterium]
MILSLPFFSPWSRLFIAAVGFLPVAALVPSLGGWVPLAWTTLCVTVPAWLLLLWYAGRNTQRLKCVALVILAGMGATLIYDGVRLTLTELGGLRDGIPNIGRMMLGDFQAPLGDVFVLSYFYRYLGDGGGLALAYFAGQRFAVRTGMIFGACVCLCLWATLAVFPIARQMLFPLTPYALMMTMVGHLVFGGILGFSLSRLISCDGSEQKAPTASVGAGEMGPSGVDRLTS